MAHDPDLEKMRMLAEEGVKALGGYEGSQTENIMLGSISSSWL